MEERQPSVLPSTATLEAIMENSSDGILIVDASGCLTYLNSVAEQLIEQSKTAALGQSLAAIFPPAGVASLTTHCQHVRQTGNTITLDVPLSPQHLVHSAKLYPVGDEHVCISLQESAYNRRLEIIAAGQRDALSKALSGACLEDVLAILVSTVEKQSSNGAGASICLVSDDASVLTSCIAPGLPDEVREWLRGRKIDTEETPCGSSVISRQPVAVHNITEQARWPEFSQLAARHGAQACWWTPILATENRAVLGVFGLFYPTQTAPLDTDIKVIDALSRTAAIVIERMMENKARLRAESALSENTEILNKQRRLYETALSNTVDPIYIFDLDERFTYVNDALLEMWGITWDEAIGKNCLELGYEKWHADMHSRELQQVIRTKKPLRGDVPFTGTHGRRIYDYIFVPVIGEDGNVEAIAGSTRDVTERQQAVEIAKEAEARRRIALEASRGFGIWDWDIKNDIFTADERLGELFNLSPEETKTGVSIERPLQSVHKDDIERIEQAINESIEHGEPYRQEYRIVQEDGSIRWGSFRGRVLFDENGVASRFPGVGVDVTRERNAINALQEADQRKDEFLATLAHELRNPLAPINNALKIIQSSEFQADKKHDASSLVERHVQQLIRLVDDLMDVSRITRGKIRLNRAPVNLCRILEAAIETVQPLLDEKQHQLSVSFPPQAIWVDGDAIRLSQVFSNIINNAAKYTEDGGHVWVSMAGDADDVVVSITDNGTGIPSDKLETVFDMFSQVDGGLDSAQGGLGIGLTLVRRLTELHQGSVTVSSEGIDKGTCFTVRLAQVAAPDQSVPSELKTPAVTSKHEKIKVLIADDNLDAATTMGWILEVKGCEVTVVEDGLAALAAVEQITPDLVLLDIGMPGMNGYDACIALRQKAALQHAMFVAQTGWGQPSHIKRSQESGFHHHLVKPLNLDDLLPILAEVQQARLQREAQ